MASTTSGGPIRFRFRRSRVRPAVQVADMMRGGRVVATITPTDTGVRLVSHDGRTWSKPRWSAKQPTGSTSSSRRSRVRLLQISTDNTCEPPDGFERVVNSIEDGSRSVDGSGIAGRARIGGLSWLETA